MKRKAVAFVFLLVLLMGAYCMTAVQPAVLAPQGSLGVFGFVSPICGTVMADGDPVPGGGGGGG
jgi:hypothetical protein